MLSSLSDPNDPYNRRPKFCTKCGRKLISTSLHKSYDPYTGEPIGNILECPMTSANDMHDHWVRGSLGSWSNYAHTQE